MAEQVKTTHVLIERELVVYQRERSTTWQCRYKVDGVWQRASTKERGLKEAKAKARDLMLEAQIRQRNNLPVVTRRFKDVAKLAIQRMEQETASKNGKVSYVDYTRVINDYLVPILGKRNITSIDHSALNELDAERIKLMEKEPSQSTLLTHNAALNRVFDEAVIRNFLTDANRPKLEAKGRAGEKRPAFDMKEVQALLGNMEGWIARAKKEKSKELRPLLRDYVDALIDTGARPGKELMNLQWKQVKFAKKPTETPTNEVDDEGEPITLSNLNRSCELSVSGKTGRRTIVGMERTVKALVRIAQRNYGVKNNIIDPFKGIATANNDDFVFRTKDKVAPTSFQNMFAGYLAEHNLLIDPITEQKRVLYSLRHTYATLALTNDKVPIHTLAKQMGTSVQMIEKHYSHLKVLEAIEQLRGEETRRLIDAGGVVDEMYKSKKTPTATKAKRKAS